MPSSRRPIPKEHFPQPVKPGAVEKARPKTVVEQRVERERHWSSYVDRFSEHQHKAILLPLSPKNKEVVYREILAIFQPAIADKKYFEKYSTPLLNEIMRDPKLSYQRLVDKISHLEERYKRSLESKNPESKEFSWLIYLVPAMEQAIFRGTISAMYEQQLSDAGISFKHEWIREFVQKITPDKINAKTIHPALAQATANGLFRAVGEWVIQKSAEQKEGAHHALLPVVKREVFASRSRVRTELGKMNDRLSPLGLSKTELLPFFRLLRKAFLHTDLVEVERVQGDVREFAREKMIQKLTALKVDARRLFTLANINLETLDGMVRFNKIVELYGSVGNPSRKANLVRTRLLKWSPKSGREDGSKQVRKLENKRRAAIGFRQTFKDRNFSVSPTERLTVYNSRIRENKISNKQRVQLIERAILAAAQIPQYTRVGEIDIATLKVKTGGFSFANQYVKALNNLVRRKKLIRVANEKYRLVK